MNFAEARKCIDSLNRFGSVLGLDNIKELLLRLDNPQDKIKVIHVAGTNGKGSTIAYLSSILKEAGYTVGKYTSPVVFEYLEKYQINDINISEEAFSSLAGKVFVITGSLEHFVNRKELKEAIEAEGGKVAGSVSAKTDYLITNDPNSGSSKNKAAREHGVAIITEDEIMEMLGF